MIKLITQKTYKKIKWGQEHGALPKAGHMVLFKAVDGKYYQTDQFGMAAAKEIADYNKALKAQIAAQTKLL
jgi:hypothetical protein